MSDRKPGLFDDNVELLGAGILLLLVFAAFGVAGWALLDLLLEACK